MHFGVTPEQLSRLLGAADDDELMSFVEEIEEVWDNEFHAAPDKA